MITSDPTGRLQVTHLLEINGSMLRRRAKRKKLGSNIGNRNSQNKQMLYSLI